MALIVLKIPTGANTWIAGECQLEGYEGYLLVERVSYDISVEAESGVEGRRTVHIPKVSDLTIERRIDMSSIDLARHVLSLRVASNPWVLYFLRDTGLPDAAPPSSSTPMQHHLCYMTMTLTEALITNHVVSVDEGQMTESLRVSTTAIDWQYTVYNDAHQPLGETAFGFDVQAGTLT